MSLHVPIAAPKLELWALNVIGQIYLIAAVGAVVLWCFCAMVMKFFGAEVLLCCSAMVLLCCGALVLQCYSVTSLNCYYCVSESMSSGRTELLLEVLVDLKIEIY